MFYNYLFCMCNTQVLPNSNLENLRASVEAFDGLGFSITSHLKLSASGSSLQGAASLFGSLLRCFLRKGS